MADLFTAPVGHGNAQFLADLQEPHITITELRNRTKAGRYPSLWAGCAAWIELRGSIA